jgi:hypothetical protein
MGLFLFEMWESRQDVENGSMHGIEHHDDLFSWKKMYESMYKPQTGISHTVRDRASKIKEWHTVLYVQQINI